MRAAIRHFAVTTALLGSAAVSGGAQELTGGDGLMYVGTYAADVHVISEEDFSVVTRIPAEAGIPGGLLATPDGSRLVAPTIDYEWVEIFDVAERRSVDRFTLTGAERQDAHPLHGRAPRRTSRGDHGPPIREAEGPMGHRRHGALSLRHGGEAASAGYPVARG